MRGSRLSSFYPTVPIDGPSMSDLDSAFQLQEYIALLIRKDPHDVDTIVANPGRLGVKSQSEQAVDKDSKGEIIVDEACWIYEQLRRLAQDLTHPLITSLQQECTRTSCPEMKAGEWLYLCVAHGNDGAMEQCCAIDYIIHTLDSATALLNSPRAFPSRISIPPSSIRHFSSLARRLGRIFAHAFFHHREAFEATEAENALYARFLALTARFDLVPPEFLVIPPRIISLDASESSSFDAENARDAQPPRLLGAALNPTASARSGSPEKENPTTSEKLNESPRKSGRARTDTMVYSDAAAFSEELRGAGGSPAASSSGLSDVEKELAAQAGRLRDEGIDDNDNDDDDDDDRNDNEVAGLTEDSERGDEGIPHLDALKMVASSTEIANACGESYSGELDTAAQSLSEPEKEKEGEPEAPPYTLTFSASGTMKGALPPGVIPSSSAITLEPALLGSIPDSDASGPKEEGQPSELMALETLSDTLERTAGRDNTESQAEREEETDARLAALVARKNVLDAAAGAASESVDAHNPPLTADNEGVYGGENEAGTELDDSYDDYGRYTGVERELQTFGADEPRQYRFDDLDDEEPDNEEKEKKEGDDAEETESVRDLEFVMIGKQGEVCPEPNAEPRLESTIPETSGAQPEDDPATGAGTNETQDAIDATPEGPTEKPAPETAVEEETPNVDFPAEVEDVVKAEEADTSLDPNVTLDEDLADVEKVLRD
ncbi:hypothetical protein EW145_g3653 [Phellinidium pouzarii]|uniref:Mob1/phocein n=1 Tax=Phellinidium pouzarii TaxID=167371 RepID=A0A4S4L6K4_9AGAM|nr:hypothetical protein EW145_g3653 [Phellinidium pouzarii]